MSQRSIKLAATWTIPNLAQSLEGTLRSSPVLPLPSAADDLRISMRIFRINKNSNWIYMFVDVFAKASVRNFGFDYRITVSSPAPRHFPSSSPRILYHQETSREFTVDRYGRMSHVMIDHSFLPYPHRMWSIKELIIKLEIGYKRADLMEVIRNQRRFQAMHLARATVSPLLPSNLDQIKKPDDEEAVANQLLDHYRKSTNTNLKLRVTAAAVSQGAKSRIFRVDKQILVARCRLFDTMFGPNGRFVEASRDKVSIRDVPSIEAFDHFLAFLYSGRMLADDADSVIELLILADLYQMDQLKQLCEDSLQTRLISIPACMEMFSYAELYNASGLQQMVFEYLFGCFERDELLMSPEWTELDLARQNELFCRMMKVAVKERKLVDRFKVKLTIERFKPHNRK